MLSQVKDNLLFLSVSAGIVLLLFLLARLPEGKLIKTRTVSKSRRIAVIAACSAVAAILHMLDFPLLFLAPEFYRLDLSELPILLCGFYLGPSAGVACEALKILLKLLLKGTSTAFVGDFANFVVGCSLILPAIAVYRAKKTRASAIFGLGVGTAVLCVFGSIFNAVYLLPKFSALYGIPLESILAMGEKINPHIRDLTGFILLAVVPINLIKGVCVSVLTVLLYKRVARPLFGK